MRGRSQSTGGNTCLSTTLSGGRYDDHKTIDVRSYHKVCYMVTHPHFYANFTHSSEANDGTGHSDSSLLGHDNMSVSKQSGVACTLQLEEAVSSETLVTTHQSTWLHIPENLKHY